MVRVVGFFAGIRDKVHGLEQISWLDPADYIIADAPPSPDEMRRHATSCGHVVPPGRCDPIYYYCSGGR